MPDDRITLLHDPRKPAAEPAPTPVAAAPTPAVVAAAPPPPPPRAREAGPARKAVSPSGSTGSGTEETLRVNVGLLESLMNLVGELVLSRNQLRNAIGQHNVQALGQADQRLNTVTSELQDAVMRTRLQPIGNVFNKFPRVVRDTAAALGKDIDLDIRGKDVALDRSLIEGLSDPLTHMLRNAVDHGVEMPDERIRAGKRRTGTIRIDARHEAGQVVVEISDDGKGIDPRRIADSAVTKGLITAEKAAGLSDTDKVALIFLPGLSTSTKVSDISGRGVGMDVVKTNLDRLGGKVEISSEVGKGTTFRIKLPLTLAIIPSLILSVEGEQFAIPQINVEELLRVRAEEVKRRIEVVGGAEVLLLRDRIIPIVRLDRMLGVAPTYEDRATGRAELDRRDHLADRRSPHFDPQAADADHAAARASSTPRSDGRRKSPTGALEIAVVTTGTLQYGLVVGGFHSTEEIVVKPLGRHLKTLREYAGATILGDGRIALILDVGGVAAKADLAAVSGSVRAMQQTAEAERERLEDLKALLLFHNSPEEVCAVPLDSVVRLERVAATQIETTGSRRTMQYRGASLPLLTLADAASVMPLPDSRELAVIVGKVHGREVGLIGTMPVDVVETKAAIDLHTHRQPGIAGSAILNGKTTLIVDLIELVDMVHPDWRSTRQAPADFDAPALTPDIPHPSSQVVLLAEDSDFFRNQVTRVLQEEGYEVLGAPDGEAAWELLLANIDRISLVVTDIEMPKLTGLGLAQRIRAHQPSSHLPIIALTSLAGEDDVAKGRAAGIDDYQVKLDRDRLVESLHATAALPSRTAHPSDTN
jgi:two-component system chemotaxis sensor kinase CheA